MPAPQRPATPSSVGGLSWYKETNRRPPRRPQREGTTMFAAEQEIKRQIAETFMRGFRAAVSGEPLPPKTPPRCAYRSGYEHGLDDVSLACAQATAYAERVVESSAMAQAKRNAKPDLDAARRACGWPVEDNPPRRRELSPIEQCNANGCRGCRVCAP